MSGSYELTTPLVMARTPRGVEYVYRPALLPEDTDTDQVKVLLRDGLVKESAGLVSTAYDDAPKQARAKS